jgi:hypothetical protein
MPFVELDVRPYNAQERLERTGNAQSLDGDVVLEGPRDPDARQVLEEQDVQAQGGRYSLRHSVTVYRHGKGGT